jgi:uncharacterized protein YwgA
MMMFDRLDEYEKSDFILFVLAATDEIQLGPIGKKQLQKVVYIIEAVSPIKEVIDDFLYRKKNYGPYSKDIQNIVNVLIVYDLAKIIEQKPFDYRGEKRLRTTYGISGTGKKVVRELRQYPAYEEKSKWIQKIVKIISLYGINKIVDLVYAEPTFQKVRKFHQAIPINETEKNLSVELMKFLKEISEGEFEHYVENDDLLLIDFFDFLHLKAFGGDNGVR